MTNKIIFTVLILLTGISFSYIFNKSFKKTKVEGVSVTPTLSPSVIPTFSVTPSPTPIPTKRFIPTNTPSPTPVPTSSQQTEDLSKTTLNDYMACKSACPQVAGGTTCTPLENGVNRCTTTSSQPDSACIDSCKNKYGLTF